MSELNVAYVKHPLSKVEAEKIRAEGFRILDLKFKPETISKGDKVIDGKPKARATKKQTKTKDK